MVSDFRTTYMIHKYDYIATYTLINLNDIYKKYDEIRSHYIDYQQGIQKIQKRFKVELYEILLKK